MQLTRTTLIASLVAMPLVLGAAGALAQNLTPVPNAVPKIVGVTLPTVLSPQLQQLVRAQGSMVLENPVAQIKYYGYLGNSPDPTNLLPPPNTVSNVEATKTEPDKNTYLVMHGLKGADPNYDYGTHFLFQGHEGPFAGPFGQTGYITRINLDADAAHRVTLVAHLDSTGNPLPTIDGSTWYPWSGRLLFTAEGNGSTTGGVWQATPDYPSVAEPLLGVFGRGGYEGIQADSDGNIWLVEDIGGSVPQGPPVQTAARVPNSFVYRFIPKNKHDLAEGGKLQVLQVMSKAHPGQPIVFDSTNALTQDIKDLHTYGLVFDTTWVTIHDTATNGFATFNANALAKSMGGTPFKRPENGVFRPGSGFREFFFTETGDTNSTTVAAPDYGGFGGIQKLTQSHPSANTGKLTLFFHGDQLHTGLDNIQFWSERRLAVGEDRGDGLHSQGNGLQPTALDSIWLFDTTKNYALPANTPIRILAQGRDPSATIDSALLGSSGFVNDGDNETTGIHVSDGDPHAGGILGAKIPRPFKDGWRVFYTQQHGDNVTYEIIRARRHDGGRDDDDHDDDDHHRR